MVGTNACRERRPRRSATRNILICFGCGGGKIYLIDKSNFKVAERRGHRSLQWVIGNRAIVLNGPPNRNLNVFPNLFPVDRSQTKPTRGRATSPRVGKLNPIRLYRNASTTYHPDSRAEPARYPTAKTRFPSRPILQTISPACLRVAFGRTKDNMRCKYLKFRPCGGSCTRQIAWSRKPSYPRAEHPFQGRRCAPSLHSRTDQKPQSCTFLPLK